MNLFWQLFTSEVNDTYPEDVITKNPISHGIHGRTQKYDFQGFYFFVFSVDSVAKYSNKCRSPLCFSGELNSYLFCFLMVVIAGCPIVYPPRSSLAIVCTWNN